MPTTPAPTTPALRIVSRRTMPAWMLRRVDEPRPDPEIWGQNRWRQALQPYLRVVK